jgi:Sec-independent protein secretion pathway component TatC
MRILLLPFMLIGMVLGFVGMCFAFACMVLMAPIVILFGRKTIENGKIVYKL